MSLLCCSANQADLRKSAHHLTEKERLLKSNTMFDARNERRQRVQIRSQVKKDQLAFLNGGIRAQMAKERHNRERAFRKKNYDRNNKLKPDIFN